VQEAGVILDTEEATAQNREVPNDVEHRKLVFMSRGIYLLLPVWKSFLGGAVECATGCVAFAELDDHGGSQRDLLDAIGSVPVDTAVHELDLRSSQSLVILGVVSMLWT
jgi:hypothetical protein